MNQANNIHFYTNLPLREDDLSDLMANEQAFADVPGDWRVVLTDIQDSTSAVQNGLHQEVNLIATGSIIAALNIAHEAGITIPFFFGGDGATLLVPDTLVDEVMGALLEHQENTRRNFDLHLRVGQVRVSDIYERGHILKIVKTQIGEQFSIPVVVGSGLDDLENLIKGESLRPYSPKFKTPTLNLDGMECKWDRIQPPENLQEVVCLLVDAQNEEAQASAFKAVLDKIDRIYGSRKQRNPVSVGKLRLDPHFRKMLTEMRVKLGRDSVFYLIKNWLIIHISRFYFQLLKGGRNQLRRITEFSDTLAIDGRINTVITGTPEQRRQLIAELDQLEQKGVIRYGIHVSPESIVSCYVRGRDNEQVHFVDGSEGGYTQAARVLKGKVVGS